MKYTVSGNSITRDGKKIGDISYVGSGVRFNQAMITGPATFTLERDSLDYKIMDNGIEMGTVKKGMKIEYNFTKYDVNNRNVTMFRIGRDKSLNILSSGDTVATITRVGGNHVIDCISAGSEIPAFSVYAILSRNLNGLVSYNDTSTSRSRTTMPAGYRALSAVLSIAAILFLYSAGFGFLSPGIYDIIIFVILLVWSRFVWALGAKKGKTRQADDLNNPQNLN
jgi:hypothetical protein